MNMNNYKPSNKLIIFCFTSLFLLANDSYAVDMGILQEQCAEIGFKMKTPANGKCVLRLMKRFANQQAKEADQQEAYVNQQTAQAEPKIPASSSTSMNGALEHWTMVGSSDEEIVYYDQGSIQENGYLVKMWTLGDFKKTKEINGMRFLSAKIQMEYDCKEDQFRPLAGSVLSGNMGKGDIVHSESNQPGQWKSIEHGSSAEIVWGIACGKSFVKQPVQQQNEAGSGTTLLQVLGSGVQLLGAAAQGYSQGRQQSAPVPSYQPTTAHCNSAYSSLSKSVETTCTQY
ncbi:surface-adhesin E family protein [Methylobacter svalbardensis]|uniref:surface-adhesin E family protein n=1 Tax=Methylobacter svalbardensis TaxID=3080016 RepID=UPI0030EB8150